MNQTVSKIHQLLLNRTVSTADQYYKCEFDRLTKQIYYDGEYWQLFVSNGIITKIVNMKHNI